MAGKSNKVVLPEGAVWRDGRALIGVWRGLLTRESINHRDAKNTEHGMEGELCVFASLWFS